MRTLELFCGTKSFSKVMFDRHATFTVDNDEQFHPDLIWDLSTDPFLSDKFYNYQFRGIDILWASPPCTAFSVASIGSNWTGGKGAYIPKTERAELGIALVKNTLKIIDDVKPMWWFIENPRGVLRKLPFMEKLERRTITYCQYGDTRMKPTDIWTNAIWWKPRLMCKNGDPCHEPAPRGARTGTQGLKNSTLRGAIPSAVFEEFLEQMPERPI